jgi:primase-polymerase (primpol)-like protein
MTIPGALEELLELNHWIAWKYEERDGKRTKVPYCPETGERADSTDPKTWRSFRVAASAVERAGYEGVGFVFCKEAGYVGVDLDGCFDEEDCPTDMAMMILSTLNTYAEYSPSGNGLHVFIKGAMPGGGRRNNALGVEAYDTGRFFTMSFKPYGKTRPIAEGGAAWEAMHDLLFPSGPAQPERAETRGPAQPMDLSDTDLIQRMVSSKSGGRIGRLLSGDTSDYGGDDSSADMALCSDLAWWCAGDMGRMDRIFRGSGLMREKWDAKRGPETYGQRTITRAAWCKRAGGGITDPPSSGCLRTRNSGSGKT